MSPVPTWWGRGDLNPGPRAPRARILVHARPRPRFLLLVICLGWDEVIKTLRWLKKIREQKTMKK